MPTADYRAQTEENVRTADVSLWFGSADTPGAKATITACQDMGCPHLIIVPGRGIKPSVVAT